MAVIKMVTGFTDTQGVAQKGTGKPYKIGRLFRLTPIKGWENEHGRQITAGYNAEERMSLDIDLNRQGLASKLLALQEHYPCDLEIIIEPHPEDPLKNIIVDVLHPMFKAKGE